MNINYIFLYLTTFFIFIYFLFKKYKILQENISYSEHKKLGKSNKSPILIGGVFIVISLLILLPKNLIFFKIASILIFLVGVLSDKNIISSPKLRLFFQVSIIFFLVYFEKLYIIGVNIHFIDYLLNISYFNYFFTIFCFAVLVNGSNFLDGLNGLLSGYFILVLISTFYVSNYQINVSNDIKEQQLQNNVKPSYIFPHANGYCAVIGGTDLNSSRKWNGYVFVGDFCTGTIWAIDHKQKTKLKILDKDIIPYSITTIQDSGNETLLVGTTSGNIFEINLP